MNVVSDSYIELIENQFFNESRFLRTYGNNNNWKQINRKIQQREIRSHFSGTYYIGIICRNTPTSILIFDIDSHNLNTSKTLKYRTYRVFNKFGNPDFIFTSPNGGYHLYYHLDHEYHPNEIQSIVRHNVRIRSGEIEFYPNGNGMRLFGGKNCILLDNNLKNPGINPEEYVQIVWKENEPLILSNLLSKPFIEFSNRFISECEYLLKHGLQTPSSRNEALLKLNRFLQGYKNFSQEKTAEILINWIKNKNNGLSKDWKRNSRCVIKQIHAIVKKYDESKFKGISNYYFPHSLLSDNDMQSIKILSLELAKSFMLDFHFFKEFLIDLIAYCKYHQIQGIVEIPRGIFQNCTNGSGKRYIKFKNALQKSGILTIKENYSTTLHKCYKYKLLEELC